jgi:isochorismate hydrolase
VDAIQSGFVPVVVREAVGDRSSAAHEQSLFDLEQKYADVVSLDEVTAYLGGLGAKTSSVSGQREPATQRD